MKTFMLPFCTCHLGGERAGRCPDAAEFERHLSRAAELHAGPVEQQLVGHLVAGALPPLVLLPRRLTSARSGRASLRGVRTSA